MKPLFLIFSCLAFSLQLTAQVNLTTSLNACYALNGNATEPINSLTGTLSAITPTVDQSNTSSGACYFNGSAASYIALPNDPLLKSTVAMSFGGWVKPGAINSQYLIFTKNNASSNFEAYSLTIVNSGGTAHFRAEKNNGSNNAQITGTSAISVNNWYHAFVTVDNSSIKIYVNGVLESSAPATSNFSYMAGKQIILGGSNESSFNLPYTGALDNIRFYNRILNATEISQLYSQNPVCAATGTTTTTSTISPVATFSASTYTLCAGGFVTLTDLSSNGPTAWNWQLPGATPASASIANPVFSFPNAGVYQVSLVSSNAIGASNTATLSVFVTPNPTITLQSSHNLLCAGSSATLITSGASAYSWSNGQTSPYLIIMPLTQTGYTVMGTNNNGCTASASYTQIVINPPVVSVLATSSVICVGQSITLNASGAGSYTWSNFQNGASVVVSPSMFSTYTVTGADANGCTGTATISVNVILCATGIEQLQSATADFSVYPNPTGGLFALQFENKAGAHFSISDVTGHVLFSGKVEQGYAWVDLSAYSAGIYFLEVTGNGNKSIKKIIRN